MFARGCELACPYASRVLDQPVLVLGAGYTGTRLIHALLRRGVHVVATRRSGEPPSGDAHGRLSLPASVPVHVLDTTEPGSIEAMLPHLPERFDWVHLATPPHAEHAPREATEVLLRCFGPRARHIVYVSSTGVYGTQRLVDHLTAPDPSTARGRARLRVEDTLRASSHPVLVLRSSAIYGPHRGVHARMRQGIYRVVGEGRNMGSRIHVDDLVQHIVRGLERRATGAYPVADELPARAIDLAAFCAARLGVAMPTSVSEAEAHPLLRVTRAVDGKAIRERLGLTLAHPNYRRGIPASLDQENGS